MTTLDVYFDQTEQDLLAANLHFYRRSPYRLGLVRVAIWLGVGALAAGFLVVSSAVRGERSAVYASLAVMAVFVFPLFLGFLAWWRSPRQVTKTTTSDP